MLTQLVPEQRETSYPARIEEVLPSCFSSAQTANSYFPLGRRTEGGDGKTGDMGNVDPDFEVGGSTPSLWNTITTSLLPVVKPG